MGALSLGGCGTSIDDAVPGAAHTGRYPNLNIPQQAATEQFTDAEASATASNLAAARTGQGETPAPDATPQVEALRKLGDKHATEALQQIEK